MDNQATFKIDSKAAQRDLDALSAALDRASSSASKMDRTFAQAANSADKNLKTASRSMERYAQIAGLLSKIKFSGDGINTITAFGNALDKLGRVRSIKGETIRGFVDLIDVAARAQRLQFNAAFGASLRDVASAMDAIGRARPLRPESLRSFVQLIEVVGRAQRLRIDPGFAAGIKNIAGAMDHVGRARAIRQATLKSFVDFIEIAARSQRLRFNPATAQSLREFGRAMGQLRPPGKAAIDRLERLFHVLATAKRIPGAAAIARDLDMVAASAGRASAALGNLPGRLRNTGTGAISRNLRDAAAGAGDVSKSFRTMGADADKGSRGLSTLGERLRGLNHRFSLTYQAGTLFTAMFASFTFGGFVKSVFDASINLAKLEKAMLFATKTVEGGHRATQEFIATTFNMGLQLDTAAEAYGRFSISASAAGLQAQTSKQIFDSVAQTLQIVGASAQQQEYAFYGLTQMIQKGKVSSEEFNRQIGEQIPGNAAAGAAAMSELLGRTVQVAEFFDMMAKGQIMSAQFVPAYARQLEKMFGDMRGLLDARPDIAVSRLRTAFTIFQQEVGKNNFMQEVGQQLNRLAGLFGKVEDGVFKLNPRAQELAERLGKGLARAARFAGDALVWVFDNMDKLIFAGKALATIVVGSTFMSWGKSALDAAGSVMKLVGALNLAKTAAASTAAVETTAAARLAGGDMASIMAHRNERGYAPRQVAGSVSAEAAFASAGMTRGFGKRNLTGVRDAADLAASGKGIAETGTAAAAAGVKVGGLAMAMRGLAAAFGVFGLVAAGVVGTLTILSDKQTEIGGKSVQFGDIMAGAAKSIGDSFIEAWNKTNFGAKGFEGMLKTLGPVIESIVLSLIWMGEVAADSVMAVINTLDAADLATKGKFGEAREKIGNIGSDWSDNFDFEQRVKDFRSNVYGAADARTNAEDQTTAAQIAAKEAEAAMQQRQAALAQQDAAARQVDAARRMQDAMSPPSWQDLRSRIGALASGEYAASLQRRGPAVAGAAGAPASAPAAPVAAVTPESLNGGILATARGFLGKNETADRQSIQSFLRDNAGVNVDPKMVAWCAAFVNAVLGANGMSGTNSLAARSFMNYGEAVDPAQARSGDIAVFRRGNNAAQGHVGFFQGYDENGNVRVLGGNQGGSRQGGGGVTVTTMARGDLLAIRRANSAGGAAVGSAEDSEKAYNQAMNDYKSLQSFAAQSDPASQALAQIAARLEPLRDIIDRDETRVNQGYGTQFTPEMVQNIDRAWAGQMKELADAVNPFSAMVRRTTQENDVTAMSLAGGNESSVAWREALNNLRDQGYDIEDLSDQAAWQERIVRLVGEEAALRVQSLADAQEEFELARLRAKNLEAEVDLLRTRNELTVQNITETGSRRDSIFASLVNGSSDIGSYEDKLMGLTREQRAAFTASATEQDLAASTSAGRQIQSELSDLMATARMNSVERAYTGNYRRALESLTGLSGRSMAEMTKYATDAQKAIAENYAATIDRLENPPGFQAWIDGLEPFERRLEKMKFDFVEGLSDGITDSLMGDEVDWKSMFKDLSRQWMKAQVDEQLKGVMGWLGIGKDQAATPEAQALVDAGGGLQTAALDLTNAAQAISMAASGQAQAASTAITAITDVAGGGVSLPGVSSTGGAASAAMPADSIDEWFAKGGSASGLPMPGAANDNASPAAGASWASRLFGKGNDGQANSPLSWMGQLFGKGNSTETRGSGLMGAIGIGGAIYNWLKGDEEKPERQWSIGDVNGLINTPGAVTTTGTQVAGKSNIIADIATMAMSAYTGGFGHGGGFSAGKTAGLMGSSMSANNAKIGSWLGGFFQEGGYASAPVKAAAFHPSVWANAPQFAEGTPNTSGGMPAILHPEEAVIPLSRNRKIPVEMSGQSGGTTVVNANTTIVANDPNSFRSSRAALARHQARTLKRAAVRNLNPL